MSSNACELCKKHFSSEADLFEHNLSWAHLVKLDAKTAEESTQKQPKDKITAAKSTKPFISKDSHHLPSHRRSRHYPKSCYKKRDSNFRYHPPPPPHPTYPPGTPAPSRFYPTESPASPPFYPPGCPIPLPFHPLEHPVPPPFHPPKHLYNRPPPHWLVNNRSNLPPPVTSDQQPWIRSPPPSPLFPIHEHHPPRIPQKTQSSNINAPFHGGNSNPGLGKRARGKKKIKYAPPTFIPPAKAKKIKRQKLQANDHEAKGLQSSETVIPYTSASKVDYIHSGTSDRSRLLAKDLKQELHLNSASAKSSFPDRSKSTNCSTSVSVCSPIPTAEHATLSSDTVTQIVPSKEVVSVSSSKEHQKACDACLVADMQSSLKSIPSSKLQNSSVLTSLTQTAMGHSSSILPPVSTVYGAGRMSLKQLRLVDKSLDSGSVQLPSEPIPYSNRDTHQQTFSTAGYVPRFMPETCKHSRTDNGYVSDEEVCPPDVKRLCIDKVLIELDSLLLSTGHVLNDSCKVSLHDLNEKEKQVQDDLLVCCRIEKVLTEAKSLRQPAKMLKASQHMETDREQIVKAKNELIKKKNELSNIYQDILQLKALWLSAPSTQPFLTLAAPSPNTGAESPKISDDIPDVTEKRRSTYERTKDREIASSPLLPSALIHPPSLSPPTVLPAPFLANSSVPVSSLNRNSRSEEVKSKSVGPATTAQITDHESNSTGVNHSVDEAPYSVSVALHEGPVLGLQACGEFLFSCSTDKTLKMHDSRTLSTVHTFDEYKRAATCLEVYVTQKRTYLISASMDKMISVYDIKKRMKCATFDLGLYAMCFCVCDDILFAGLRSGSIFVISMKTKKYLAKLSCHKENFAVTSLCVMDDIICSASFDKTVVVYLINARKSVPLFKQINRLKFDKAVLSLKMHRSKLYAACMDHNVHIHSTKEWTRLHSIPHGAAVSDLIIAGCVLITSSFDKYLRCFDLEGLELLQVYCGFPDKILTLSMSNKIVYCGMINGLISATQLNLNVFYTCKWHGCQLRLGLLDHLDDFHIKEHVPKENSATVKCKWNNCYQEIGIGDMIQHLKKHVESDYR